MRNSLVIILFFITIQGICQDISDVQRLSEMSYMTHASKIDCDSSSGTNVEHRICLNLEFQELEAKMNRLFFLLLKRTDDNSIKNILIENQKVWVDNRRLQSEVIAKGYKGHMLGIVYLHCMVESTRSRITELEAILEIKN